MEYFVLKFLHIVGASVLLGTGAGIAFFMLLAHLSGKPAVVAGVARIVVLRGLPVHRHRGRGPADHGRAARAQCRIRAARRLWSIILYLVTGTFWLPVVWMQMRMRDLAVEAVRSGAPLPARYHRLFRWWFAFGFPAFGAVMPIFWLMIVRPQW